LAIARRRQAGEHVRADDGEHVRADDRVSRASAGACPGASAIASASRK
jgi:hypothetical protein